MREYIYLPETEISPTFGSRTVVDRPLAVVNAVNTASPALWYVHVDHLNRPIKMTDTTKASVWDAQWLPWGNVYAITGTANLDARFPGQWFQLESGLHYNWYRHYDPTIGRFTQPDPLGFVDGPSVYGYAASNPQAFVDPDGRVLPQLIAFCARFPAVCATVGKQVTRYCLRKAKDWLKNEPERDVSGLTRPDGVPENWECRPSQDGGCIWSDPKSPDRWVRESPGNPQSPNPAQQEPYTKWHDGGTHRDQFGNPVSGKSPEAHIPQSKFKWTNLK